jgi:hypothetical protein
MQTLRLFLAFIIIFFTTAANAQKSNYPLSIEGDTSIRFAGQRVLLSKQGFPEQMQVFPGSDGKDTTAQPTRLLAENIHFHFTNQTDGKDIRLKNGGLDYTARASRKVSWTVTSAAEALSVEVAGTMRSNGSLDYVVKVTALQDLDLKDIVMHIPFQKDAARSMIGLGKQGDYQPDSMYHWKWDAAHVEPVGAWIGTAGSGGGTRASGAVAGAGAGSGAGAIGAGLRYTLVGPATWYNEGKGGIDVGIKGKSMLVNNYSGARHLSKGDILYYNFNLQLSRDRSIN